jgi:predicted translin family RNA/ssDNA-binding protein
MAPMLRRNRFADVISRQLDLFERDEADLIRQCVEAERAYDKADRDEAEERYGDYVDLVETGTEALADLRWAYAATLDEDAAEEYEEAFNRAVKKRLPRFGNEIDLR